MDRTLRKPVTAIAVLLVMVTVVAVILVTRSEDSSTAATLNKVQRAQLQFRKYGVDSYTVDVERSCLCDTNFLTFTLTVDDGKLTHVAVRGFSQRDPSLTDAMEWDVAQLPTRYDWLRKWGPIDKALVSTAATVAGTQGVDGPVAMYVTDGDHKFVAEFSYHTRTGVPSSYWSYITNTYDSQVGFQWSNFTPLGS
jgi:hypothetical protein